LSENLRQPAKESEISVQRGF